MSAGASKHERTVFAALMACLVTLVVAGSSSVRSDESLVRAAHGDDVATGRAAANALVMRGYLRELSPAERRRFVRDCPPPVREYLRSYHSFFIRPN